MKYNKPTLEILKLQNADIVCTSGESGGTLENGGAGSSDKPVEWASAEVNILEA